jgi:hypothetical protein
MVILVWYAPYRNPVSFDLPIPKHLLHRSKVWVPWFDVDGVLTY